MKSPGNPGQSLLHRLHLGRGDREGKQEEARGTRRRFGRRRGLVRLVSLAAPGVHRFFAHRPFAAFFTLVLAPAIILEAWRKLLTDERIRARYVYSDERAHRYCRGLLRIARREGGIRIYAPRERVAGVVDAARRRTRIDAIVDTAVRIYAPLPAASLSSLVSRLRYGVRQWRGELKSALQRARSRLAHARVDGLDWYWPAAERLPAIEPSDTIRLLAPFDPVVWDRRRFEILWGWAYRFEAYTPARKRRFGYYALPLLRRDRVIAGRPNSRAGNAETQDQQQNKNMHPILAHFFLHIWHRIKDWEAGQPDVPCPPLARPRFHTQPLMMQHTAEALPLT